MAGEIQVAWKVDGLAQLEQRLEALKTRAIARALRRAVRAGGVVFRDLMRARVNRGPAHQGQPHLADDIVISTRASQRDGSATANVRPKSSFNRIKALWLEFGIKAHEITPRVAKALGIPSGPMAKVMHPGVAPHPFMRPAADEGKQRAVEALRDVLADAIDSELRK